MKIYVMTKAKLFKEEIYIGVAKSIKDAEKSLRTSYPHMRPSSTREEVCKTRSYVSDSSNQLLLFIREEEV